MAALYVVVRTLHLRHRRLDHRIDWWGAVFLTVGLVPLLIVAEQGREWGWTSVTSLLCYAVGVIGFIAGLLVERSMGDEALIPLRLFANRTVAWASIGSVFIGMGMFGGLAALPLYLQIVKGASATQAGLQLLPMTLGIMFGSILSGQLISRTGATVRKKHDHPTTPLHRLLTHHADLLDPHDTRRLTALLHDTDILAVRHHIIDIQANLIELARRRGTVQPRARTTATYLSRRKIHPPTTRAKSDESTTPPTRAT